MWVPQGSASRANHQTVGHYLTASNQHCSTSKQWHGFACCYAGSDSIRQQGRLQEASCNRLKAVAEVLSVGVACSLKGPSAEQIIKLLVTMYRLLKAVTALIKPPQSQSLLHGCCSVCCQACEGCHFVIMPTESKSLLCGVAEQIVKLLVSMYCLLNAVTALINPPQSERLL